LLLTRHILVGGEQSLRASELHSTTKLHVIRGEYEAECRKKRPGCMLNDFYHDTITLRHSRGGRIEYKGIPIRTLCHPHLMGMGECGPAILKSPPHSNRPWTVRLITQRPAFQRGPTLLGRTQSGHVDTARGAGIVCFRKLVGVHIPEILCSCHLSLSHPSRSIHTLYITATYYSSLFSSVSFVSSDRTEAVLEPPISTHQNRNI
jgi:hypothetical protein